MNFDSVIFKLKYFFQKNNQLFDFWFFGILSLIYLFQYFFIAIDIEVIEWNSYFAVFFIGLFFFISKYRNNLYLSLPFKIIFSLPFYFFIFFLIENSFYIYLILFASFIATLLYNITDNKEGKIHNLVVFIYFFVILLLVTKFVYWINFNEIIFFNVLITSRYYTYSSFINPIVTIIFFLIFFSSIFFTIFSFKYDFHFNFIKKFWWLLPLFIFFLESFSTANFFENIDGKMIHHWQFITGPIEMLKNGGYLLWDVPSQYGFLSILFAYMLPFEDSWIKFYFLNSLMRLFFCLLVFYIVWNKRGIIWYTLSILFTLSLVFFLPSGASFENSAITPAAGAFRFFWVILLMFLISQNYRLELKKQIYIYLPIFIIGFLWSIESAFYVSLTIGPFILINLYDKNNFFRNLKLFLLFPFSILFILFIISMYYYYFLNHLPDFYSFIEYAISYQQSYNAEKINIFGPAIFLIFLLSILISNGIKDNNNIIFKFSIWCGLFAIFSYFIGRSSDLVALKILVFFVISFFLIFNHTTTNTIYKLITIPLFVMIITITYTNPLVLKHLINTFNNQNYFLQNYEFIENNELNDILNNITPKDIPVIFIEPGRYLDGLTFNYYIDKKNNKKINLNKEIWMPYYPASIFVPLSNDRKIQYIQRWTERKEHKKGWLIMSSQNEHWQDEIKNSLLLGLSNYNINKTLKFSSLKAILFERIN